MSRYIKYSVWGLGFLLLMACSSSKNKVNFKKPNTVALAFIKSFTVLDFEAAKAYGTEDTEKFLQFLAQALEMADEQSIEEMKAETAENTQNIKKADCTVEGDKATCTFCCDAEGNPLPDEEVHLKRVDGKWLVHMSKEDLMEPGD